MNNTKKQSSNLLDSLLEENEAQLDKGFRDFIYFNRTITVYKPDGSIKCYNPTEEEYWKCVKKLNKEL